MTDISIFDLPQLYQKPSQATLLTAIDSLGTDAPSFEGPLRNSNLAQRDAVNYLTSLVSSPLAWLPDDDVREAVWTAASLRLSEKAGRSARPSRTHTLEIPRVADPGHPVRIHLHEPTLTSDHLGHKTWVAGYLLAKRLPILGSAVPLLERPHEVPNSAADAVFAPPPLVLELGSGTGLVGLALAHHLPGAEVHLSDLASIVPNLAANVERNFPRDAVHTPRSEQMQRKASIHVLPIDWAALPNHSDEVVCERTRKAVARIRPANYDLVIAADVLYGEEHPSLIAAAAAHFLKVGETARVVIEVPRRERAGGLVEMLIREMEHQRLTLNVSGQEEGWEEMGRDSGRVECWWGVWGWEE